MPGRIIYSEEADGHLHNLTDFLVRQAGDLTARRVIKELLERFDVLKDLPYLCREHPDPLLASRGYRVFSTGRYVGVYLAIEGGVWIAGVFHTKTDWLTRD